jgi:hypothetical protein
LSSHLNSRIKLDAPHFIQMRGFSIQNVIVDQAHEQAMKPMMPANPISSIAPC